MKAERRNNVRKNKDTILLLVLMVCIIFVTGCSRNVEVPDSSKPTSSSLEDNWRSIILSQDDGKKLYIDLPFELDNRGDYEPDGLTKNAKWYRHKGEKIIVNIDHDTVIDANTKIDFNLKTFMSGFEKKALMNAKMKVIEEKEINGKKVTYAKIIMDEYDNPQILEGVGIRTNSEYWIITYTYMGKNKDVHTIVEKSIDSIKIV